MGLTSWAGGVPRRADSAIAKNYLVTEGLEALNRIVNAYLEFAELQALNRRARYMTDWILKLDDFLRLSERDVLQNAGTVSREEAAAKAEREYARFSAHRATLPSPVEEHFSEAIREVRRIEKQRASRPKGSKMR
jgi:hypothetical protein